METIELSEHLNQPIVEKAHYHEFLRNDSMSGGIYTLPAGSEDPQQPHSEDELYFVLSGRAKIEVDSKEMPVQKHTAIFIPEEVGHRFRDIEEELRILVVFAPAEGRSS